MTNLMNLANNPQQLAQVIEIAFVAFLLTVAMVSAYRTINR